MPTSNIANVIVDAVHPLDASTSDIVAALVHVLGEYLGTVLDPVERARLVAQATRAASCVANNAAKSYAH